MDPNSARLSIFISVLVLCALWEWATPRKRLTQNKVYRWLNNLGLVAFNSVLLTLAMPVLAFETAYWAMQNHIGIFYWLALPTWVEVVLGVVLLDLAIYIQHLIFHRLPWLWRLHRMHHADQDIDVTTGARFHPIEILISMWIKIGVVIALGVSPLTVLLFEILLNASAMFNHSNAYLSLNLDKWLRKIVVTPDMHRVHHSQITRETHSNFGFCLSVWDRWFGTYIAQPEKGHDKVKIGIDRFKGRKEQRLDQMMTQPFREK
ncbi:sterol desaturase family protein [Vibrio sonorensis]|uniref:sterol desaturase family protein n=1 Tax=Vibrio sonorensis TaxID=1004316 RepID=UPI0008DA52A0|nr:sterol desaturase family protein [Vibrio sonorensis]